MTNALIEVTEATFSRQVRHARLPVVVFFAAPACEVCAALGALLALLAAEHAGRVVVAAVNGEAETLLAESYNVTAVPTLLAFRAGEESTRIIGFAPEGLLRLFFAEVAADALARQWLWSPTEQAYEERVLLPLLTLWGLRYARQVTCAIAGERRATAGRVDVLVYNAEQQPVTLFENKRLITSSHDLQQAATQARAYTQSFGLPAFVVAAPTGMWLYLLQGKRTTLVQQFSALDVHARPAVIRLLLLELGA